MHAPKNIVVFGSSGALGSAFVKLLSERYKSATVHAFSRKSHDRKLDRVTNHRLDYLDEFALEQSASIVSNELPIDLVIVATGLLHGEDLQPEKSLRDLSADKFQKIYEANAVIPALIAKHFLPKLNRAEQSSFAAISARVGSISDNHLGGWYAYRASKAALNMILKNAAIEVGRRNKKAVVIGLHPGTVDSALSEPFQGNVMPGKLFSAEKSANHLIEVLENLTASSSGKCFAWDGSEVQP